MPSYHFNTTTPEIEARIDALLACMTLAEKVGQMHQLDARRGERDQLFNLIRAGKVGSLLNVNDVAFVNQVQHLAVEQSRLGIPLIIGNDVIHGYRTIFPIPLAESCSWDPDLVQETARIAAEEASAFGIDWTFAPMVDICREPRWGRIAEGAGEDTYLGEVMAQARVRGFQAELSTGRKLAACPKHYAAYGAAEAGKDYNTVDMSERRLRDIYLPPFKAAFEAGAPTVMSSFNELNGVPATANHFLLTRVLREEWDFKGFVLSDYNALRELIPHGLAGDLREAARLSALAGLDMEMVSPGYPQHLPELVENGDVPLASIDAAVRRILRIKLLLGLFEQPYTDESLAGKAILRPEYRQTALEMAHQSMVLLKNEAGLLPLQPHQVRKLALIGPLADDHHQILGCWYRIGQDEDSESVLDGLRASLPADIELMYAKGCELEAPGRDGFGEAIAAAQQADLAVVVVGEGEYMSGEAHSRAYLGLPGEQQALLGALHATGTPLVVVLMTGRPLVIPWLDENIPAILCAWHGGIRTGQAVADLLLGTANPSGKLTASWPRAEGQIPVYYNYKNTGRPAEGEGTYQFDKRHRANFLDLDHRPLYPFGYGLSYTEFEYKDLEIEQTRLVLEDRLRVSVTVQNVGQRAGAEIIQLYVRDRVRSVTPPVKELKAFHKCLLQPGASQRVTLEVPIQHLGFHDLELRYRVEPGDFELWVGPDSVNGLWGEFSVVE